MIVKNVCTSRRFAKMSDGLVAVRQCSVLALSARCSVLSARWRARRHNDQDFVLWRNAALFGRRRVRVNFLHTHGKGSLSTGLKH